MAIKLTNNARTTLLGAITSISTTINVAAGEGARFPVLGVNDYFYATLEDASSNIEIVKVTALIADMMTVIRGQQNTTAMSFATASAFELRVTTGMLTDYIDQEIGVVAVALAVAL